MIEPRAKVVGTGNLTVFYVSTPIGTELTTVADVLSALRQPSEAMKLTGSLAIQEHYCADGGFCGLRAAQEQMTLTWEAMLDQFERDQGSAT